MFETALTDGSESESEETWDERSPEERGVLHMPPPRDKEVLHTPPPRERGVLQTPPPSVRGSLRLE